MARRDAANTFTGTQTFQVAPASSMTLKFDRFVPGLNFSTPGFEGAVRLRNQREVWPGEDGTRAGFLAARSASGATLEGAHASLSLIWDGAGWAETAFSNN